MFTSLQQTELEWNFIANSHNYPKNRVIRQLAVKFDKTPQQIRNWFKHQRSKNKIKNCTSASTSSSSLSSSCSTNANSLDVPPEIFCSINCTSCLAHQNPVSVNPTPLNPPSPIPTIIDPHPLTPQSSSACPSCESIFKLVDRHYPDNSMTTYFEIMNKLMHIKWSTIHPLMNNWPDTSDLYRRMDHNLVRFVNDLI